MCKSVSRTTLGVAVVLGAMAVPALGSAQIAGGPPMPPLMDQAEEVALALSAAPSRVSREATVLVLNRGGFVKAREGTNGVTCMVDRYYTEALEPQCFNSEAAATILPVLLRRNELREQGLEPGEIDEAIERGYREGEFRLPQRLALAYMFSSDQEILSDAGTRHGNYVPHLMIFVPYLTPETVGGQASRPGDPVVFRAGRRDAALIVPIRGDFVTP